MKQLIVILFTAVSLLLTGCGVSDSIESSSLISYRTISQEQAAEIMQQEEDCIILDVRTQEEYESGRIPGAILLPNELITDTRLPDLNRIILVYCRRGNRSKEAAQKLADMGYTRVLEFGGINTWKDELVTN